MAMSKKDYEAIAGIVRDSESYSSSQAPSLIERLADYFGQDNPRFRREQFLAACRGESFDAPLGNGKTRKVNYGL
jgi:alpha-amylase/alpha-mannosidase (GH57 family)